MAPDKLFGLASKEIDSLGVHVRYASACRFRIKLCGDSIEVVDREKLISGQDFLDINEDEKIIL